MTDSGFTGNRAKGQARGLAKGRAKNQSRRQGEARAKGRARGQAKGQARGRARLRVAAIALLALALLAGACTSTEANKGATRKLTTDEPDSALSLSLSDIAALSSAKPASGFGDGGGGVGGGDEGWGLFGGDAYGQPGQWSSMGVRPLLKASGTGTAYKFKVFKLDGTEVWSTKGSSQSVVVPEGKLIPGEVYSASVWVGSNRERSKPFVVGGGEGAVTAGIGGVGVTSGAGGAGLGIAFSSSAVGVTAETGVSGALPGLPAGWSWAGMPGGVTQVEVSTVTDAAVAEALGAQPGGKVVKVRSSGGSVTTLGCQQASETWVCASSMGLVIGEGPSATIAKDGSVQVMSPGSATLSFDSGGKLTGAVAPGALPTTVSYTQDGGLDKVTWNGLDWKVLHAGDTQCDDSDLPPGFVATPEAMACGWVEPSGIQTRLFYTQPSGAAVSRLSRAVSMPASCTKWQDCTLKSVSVTDWGWDDHNRLAATRSPQATWLVLSGASDQANDDLVSTYSYDDAGRVVQATGPAPSAGGPRQVVASTYGPFVPTAQFTTAKYPTATHQVTTTSSNTVDSEKLSSTALLDDGGRTVVATDPTGNVTESIWLANKNVQLGTKDTSGVMTTSTYDVFYRPTAQYAGPIDAFPPGCNASLVTDELTNACQPSALADQVAISTTSYDGQSTADAGLAGQGLRATWWAGGGFAGNPVAYDVRHQESGSFTLAPPAGAGSSGVSVRLEGGVVLDPSSTWQLMLTPTQGWQGSVYVDEQFCGVIDPTGRSTTCNPPSLTDPDDPRKTTALAHHIRIDLGSQAKPTEPAALSVKLENTGGGTPYAGDSHFVAYWGAATGAVLTDPTPGTTTTATYTSVTSFLTDQKVKVNGTDIFEPTEKGTPVSATIDPGGLALTTQNTYEDDGYGSFRLKTVTQPAGNKVQYSYWGLDDTPTSAGLGSLGDMPSDTSNPLGDIATTPQRGLPRAVTDPSGRTVTTVYDGYGQPVCTQVATGGAGSAGGVKAGEADGVKAGGAGGSSGTGGATGTVGARGVGAADRWSCVDAYDDMLRATQSTTRSTNGSATQTLTTDFWGSSNDPLTTVTTDKDTGVALTEKVDWAGSLAAYTDGIGTQTAYTYDNMGRSQTQTITLPSGSQGGPYKYESAYDSETGLLTSTTLNGKALVDMKYDSVTAQYPSQIASYTYLGGKLVNTPQRDEYNRPIGQAWTNSNGSSVLDETFTRTAVGTLTDDTLATQGKTGKYAYTYDTAGRLATANVADHAYGYTWDSNTNMVGQSIDSAQYAYAYDGGDRLVSSTDPNVVPATSDAFDANGNYANLNSQTYTYDANQRLTSIASAGGQSGGEADSKAGSNQGAVLTYVRDPQGRPTQTTDQGKATTLSYTNPGDQMPAVYTDKATSNATPIVSLPGGLIHTPSNNWITDAQGHAGLVLDDNAMPIDGTIQQWQPYGQPATALTGGTSAGPNPGWHSMPADLNGTVIDLGARTLHTNLTLFTQPDPIHGGSGAGPHNYTTGDSVNSMDLTGTIQIWAAIKNVGNFLKTTYRTWRIPKAPDLEWKVKWLPTDDFVYRGVGFDPYGDNVAYNAALKGMVSARNPKGKVTPEQHNCGPSVMAKDSPYTSWSFDQKQAQSFAGTNGVVIKVPAGERPADSPWQFVWSPNRYNEAEVLIRGPVTNAEVVMHTNSSNGGSYAGLDKTRPGFRKAGKGTISRVLPSG